MTNPPRRDRRVVYLITSSGVGGAERQVRDLALALRQRGWDVGVISMLPLEPFLGGLEHEGIKTATLGMRRGTADPRGLLRLRALLQDWRPDVLHAHMVHANLLARVSRLIQRTPVVISTMHNENEGGRWLYLAYRLSDRLSDLATAVSTNAVAEAVRRRAAPRARILLVPNGIRPSDYRADPDTRQSMRRDLGLAGRWAWLAVGRLSEQKAYPDLIDAFRHVCNERPDARLLIVGVGELEASIRSKIVASGLENEVSLLGLRSDVGALMQAADAFVMSSAWEGLPMVLLEASASSLPIVATDVGGSRDAVLDGTTGLLVKPRSPEALASAMLCIMAMPQERRAAFGTAGRDHISRQFDLTRIVTKWEALYLERLGIAT